MRCDAHTAGYIINTNFLSDDPGVVTSKLNLPTFGLYSCLWTYCIYGSGGF